MANAARAIIIHNNKMLLMKRNKQGSDYYTLVGGKLNTGESAEVGLAREVREETGLKLSSVRLVFTEKHSAPYNNQFIFLCETTNHDSAMISPDSEEALLNRIGMGLHELNWVDLHHFERLPFFTMQLQAAITAALKNGFPKTPIAL